MIRYFRVLGFFLLFFMAPLVADENKTDTIEQNISKVHTILNEQLQEIEEMEKKGNVWTKIYSNYLTYQELKTKEESLFQQRYKFRLLPNPSKQEKEQEKSNKIELQIIGGKLELLKEFQDDPFKRLMEPPVIKDVPEVGNPIGILGAISFKKKLTEQQSKYEATYTSLLNEVDSLHNKRSILIKLFEEEPNSVKIATKITDVQKEIDTFKPVLEIFETTKEVYSKRIEESKLKIDVDIGQEYEKMFKIIGIIVAFFLIFLLAKYLVRRYMSSKDSYYTINKAANFIFLTILGLVLLFAYIENVSYMVTVIGFASAGIAIAMKDWFMSLMGWWVIVIGGSIHVGDRVKFVRDGVSCVGDIVDISPLRMTMQEDVTLTTFMENRRSGRIIFIPNNYVFTDMIANYSHAGLKTVWDGIDFTITFDSNIDKAISIAKDVTKKYSKGYTDITRKQLNGLRSQYHIKNTNVEPRILSFIEPHGMVISAWYLTNAFATLTLRSKISVEIIQQIQERDDIKIAYPTQSLYVNNNIPKPELPDVELVEELASKEKDNS
ncbi:MAG TPA: mechanosensitive ion channel [Sulfurovum sp.]|nr:mechanosensitive ion channel [Sulfurovum sp.]